MSRLNLSRDRVALVLGTGGGALLTMIWMAWAGRVLGPAKSSDLYGGVFLIFAVYMVGHPLNGVTARFAALWGPRDARAMALHGGLTRLLLKLGLGVGVLFALTSGLQGQLLHFADQWALGLAELAAWLVLLLSVSRGLLRGVSAFEPFAGTMLLEPAARLALGAALLYWMPTVISAMTAYVIASALTVWVARRMVSAAVPASAAEPVPSEVWRFALPMLLMALADAAYQNVDVLIAKRALTPTTAGQFGAMATLTRALAVVVQPFALMVIPLLTGRAGARNDQTLWRLTLAFILLASLPMAVFIWAPDELLTLVFGPSYSAAAQWLPTHAAGSLACFITLMIAQAFAAVGRFGFLWGYCGIASAMAAALWWVGGDPVALVRVGAAAKVLCLLLTLGVWLLQKDLPNQEPT